jgi:GINS complex subunit 1
LEYFQNYNKLLTSYNEAIDLDLTSDLEPPRDLFVEIRVLISCGELVTESGPVSLDQGSTHYLRRSDVEHLIRLGHVEMFHS